MLIINGNLHPMDSGVIPCGYIQIKDSKISKIGPMSQVPLDQDEEVIDAKGCHVTPGYIDAHCHIGVMGDDQGPDGDDSNEMTGPCTADVRAVDAINPWDRSFREARLAGVTTVVTGPGSANPINGQLAAIKTSGSCVDDMIVRAPLAMKLALGENPKRVYGPRHQSPSTRMATAALIRRYLRQAQEYGKARDAADHSGTALLTFDAEMEALLPVVKGELPVHIHAHRADDIATGIRLAKEFSLRCVIVHGTEGHLIPEQIANAGVPVITGPLMGFPSKYELKNRGLETPAILKKNGVKIAICTDYPEIQVQYLPICAGMAVRGGLSEEYALAAITLEAARICGIDHRVGSLTVGKDADIVISEGDPLDVKCRVRTVLINGERITD